MLLKVDQIQLVIRWLFGRTVSTKLAAFSLNSELVFSEFNDFVNTYVF